jgi:hypothetical protein
MHNYVQRSRRFGEDAIAIGRVKEGANYIREGYWIAENIEPVIEGREVLLHAIGLTLAAKRRGWSIARTTTRQNLIAVWLVENGYVSEVPVAPVEGKIAVALDIPW